MRYLNYKGDEMEQKSFDQSVNADIAERVRVGMESYAIDEGRDAIFAAKCLMESRLSDINMVYDLHLKGETEIKKSALVGQVIYYVQNLDQYNGEIMRAFAGLIKIGQ
jgi:hypothetical protein